MVVLDASCRYKIELNLLIIYVYFPGLYPFSVMPVVHANYVTVSSYFRHFIVEQWSCLMVMLLGKPNSGGKREWGGKRCSN